MKLLLSNDDGIHAPGLQALFEVLRPDYELMVIAPDRDRSGVSNCLTLDRPLQATELDEQRISLDGTPTDCVHLGTAGIFMEEPDRVISGINYGPNLGDDVLYSGTLAAAMEGRFLKQTAIALSLAATERSVSDVSRFATAAAISAWLVKSIAGWEFPPRTVLNVNIPDLPAHAIKGIALTTLGQRVRGENPISTVNPRGKTLYWIGRAGGPVELRQGSDFHAVEQGYVSVTALHADMTSSQAMAAIEPQFTALRDSFDPSAISSE